MKKTLLLVFLTTLCTALSVTGGVPSGVPNMLSYQGLLTAPSGAPVADGSYNLKFELFYFSGGGSAAWSETQVGITISRGTFNVLLGSLVSLPGIFNSPLYLEVTAVAGPGIGAPVTFSPRTQLASAAYALGLKLPFTGTLVDAGSGIAIWNYGSGQALTGYHGSSVGTTAAISAQTYSTDASARALEGIVVSTSPGGSSTAVRGQNNGTGGLGIGVWGSQNGSGWGVYGSAQSGFGVYGFSNTGYGVVSSGKLSVNAPAGDASVLLPNSSISSAEILDEPGVANSIGGDFFVTPPVGGSMAADSVDITAPADGYVEVSAGCYLNLWHDSSSQTIVYLSVDTTRGLADFQLSGSIVASIPAKLPTDYYQQGGYVSRLFPVSAGTHRYYFNTYYVTGTSISLNLANSYVRAIYFPTLYGSLSLATSSTALDKASSSASNGSQGQMRRAIQTITMAEHNAQLEAKVAAVRAEFEARIQKLEQLVGSQPQQPKQDQ